MRIGVEKPIKQLMGFSTLAGYYFTIYTGCL